MKYRIFYAPQVQSTFEKLFVLTEDGNLYCRYLNYGRTAEIKESGFNFNNFRPTNYSWGKGIVGAKTLAGQAHGAISNYQHCERELTLDEALTIAPSNYLQTNYPGMIRGQLRWIPEYMASKGLRNEDWDSSFI